MQGAGLNSLDGLIDALSYDAQWTFLVSIKPSSQYLISFNSMSLRTQTHVIS